jgi:general secretion pathway protein C
MDSSVSKVPLRLILVRTEPGRNVHDGRAFIGTARENPQTYLAGALLANGARIQEIYRDHLLLERDGKFTTMYVDGAKPDGSKQSHPTPSEMLTVGGQQPERISVVTTNEPLTAYIRPSPVYDGTMLEGYEVYPGPKSTVFSRMGLQNGDIVIALDDVPVSDPQQAMSLFAQLTEGAVVIAMIDRKGKRERIHLNGALIVEDRERATSLPSYPQTAGAPPIVLSGQMQ